MPRVKSVKSLAAPNLVKAEEVREVGKSYQAKMYKIADLQLPDLDDCWSACNGVDGFGHVDDDKLLNKVRRQYGENVESVPGTPRMILYRLTKDSDLMVKLWFLRSFDDLLDVHLVWASFAKALRRVPSSMVDADLIDWDANVPNAPLSRQDRFELSFEFVSPFSCFGGMKKICRTFMKTFDSAVLK